MKILLFNDNPVVQKLVALSAQKTKDELAVASSAEEISEGSYDLLIIDDALYSDDTFAEIREHIVYKRALLMAIRGNAVPAGFDTVINKPFLPTDLVDTLIQIEKQIASASRETPFEDKGEETFHEAEPYSIDLEETLASFEPGDEMSFEENETDLLDDEFDFGDLESFDEGIPQTAVLDQEEVQEVRELLEDADSDMVMDTETSGVMNDETIEVEEIDFDALDENGEELPHIAEPFDLESFDFDETVPDSEPHPAQQSDATDPFDFDMLGEEEKNDRDDAAWTEEMDFEEGENDLLSPEEAFDDLELKIQEAIEELEPADLEMELEGEILGAFEPEKDEIGDDLLDELDMLDERELKLAVGESLEEEPDLYVGENSRSSAAAEALGEVMGKPVHWNHAEEKSPSGEKTSSAEGVEALQALLKALANEDVAKSLKGLNISININFGNGA